METVVREGEVKDIQTTFFRALRMISKPGGGSAPIDKSILL